HGRGCGVVISTGMRTEVGKIAHTIEEKPEAETPLQKRLNTFGRKLGIFIILICTVVTVMGITREGFLTGKLITNNLIIRMVMTGISLAVAAIPEGLPAVVTITLAIGLKRLSEKNTLVRRLPITETLGSVTVICTDKTGTLTRNEMTVNRIWYIGREIQVEGSGYKPSGGFYTENKRIDPKKDKNLVLLLRTAALCNNSTLEKRRNTWSVIGDPTEGALLVAAAKAGFKHETLTKEYPRIKEIPFTSERKMMTTINTHNGRFIVSVKGAPEKILTLCKRYYINGRTRRLTKKETKIIMEENHNLTSNALRVLAVAYKETKRKPENPENDLVFLGLVGMMDLPREGVREDIELCKRAGIKVVMITGDHRNTAIAIARQLGLDSGRAITGEELDRIPDEDFENMVEDISVYARVNPEHKVRIVDALRKRGHVIAMTGDGVNDAPALKDADIGIAMGIKGTDVAKEASDMILRDDNFSSIVTAVKEGRTIYDNIKKFIQYLLSCNTAEVMIVFMAMMIGLVDPTTGLILLPVQLLWINILTDALPALALGIDPPSRDIMERKPRDPKENILSREMVSDIVIVSIIMTLGTLLLFWWNLVTESGIKAMTVAFTLIVMFEMVRVQSVRMKFRIGIFSNRKLIAAIVTSIFLQIMVVYIPAMQVIFRTVSLTLWDWIEIILMSSTVMIIMWFKERVISWNG
ncbi:MAG TPA: cation-transporting P-type ATPase, partial [Candidatus Aenigmarchaeota archaeon]|nr:cation-transporting P-type ATPase [Candidatus Aenigmarchaeota archaeon]